MKFGEKRIQRKEEDKGTETQLDKFEGTNMCYWSHSRRRERK